MAGRFNIRQLNDGAIVCKAHNLSKHDCPGACFKNQDAFFRGMEAREAAVKAILFDSSLLTWKTPKQSDYEDYPTPVPVLTGNDARFIPQLDVELLGTNAAMLAQSTFNYANMPGPLDQGAFQTEACDDCGLTWLCGVAGRQVVHDHPHHHSYRKGGNPRKNYRSIVVHTHGTVSGTALAGLGAFFCSDFEYGNISNIVPLELIEHPAWTKQLAELTAAYRALSSFCAFELPRIRAVHEGRPERRELQQMRIIVATDSAYLVEGMCAMKTRWTVAKWRDEDGKQTGEVRKQDRKRSLVKNSGEFFRLFQTVEGMAVLGIQVQWALVSRGMNKEAEKLANGALASWKNRFRDGVEPGAFFGAYT